MLRIAATSDTHTLHDRLKVFECDIFIHAGDFCSCGNETEFFSFIRWLETVPAKHKICIAGNHDICLEKKPSLFKEFKKIGAHYLIDSEVVIEDEEDNKFVKFYGSPYTPEFCNWAFMLSRDGQALKEKWSKIPNDVDILITHGPPYGILDKNDIRENCGCKALRERIEEIKPTFALWGHLHEDFGMNYWAIPGTTCINLSACKDYTGKNMRGPIQFTI